MVPLGFEVDVPTGADDAALVLLMSHSTETEFLKSDHPITDYL